MKEIVGEPEHAMEATFRMVNVYLSPDGQVWATMKLAAAWMKDQDQDRKELQVVQGFRPITESRIYMIHPMHPHDGAIFYEIYFSYTPKDSLENRKAAAISKLTHEDREALGVS